MSTDVLITLPEACRRLGVSRTWLYRQAREGRIPVVQLGPADAVGKGRVLRLNESDLENLNPRVRIL